jgi:RimJ/RimL family protein N-acetyltransferase
MLPQHPDLLFRSWSTGDGVYLFELNADPRVLQWTGDLPFHTLSAAEAFVQSYDHFNVHGFGRWLVFRKQDGACLGWCGLRRGLHGVDFGLRWFYRYWNQGYGFQAGKAVLNWADEVPVGTLHAQHHPQNIYSKALLLRLGFTSTPPYPGSDSGWETYMRV